MSDKNPIEIELERESSEKPDPNKIGWIGYCQECGRKIDIESVICLHCGLNANTKTKEGDKNSQRDN